MPLSELPSFFVKRFQAGDRTSAITLLAGIDPATGDPVLEDCRSPHDAARRIHAGRGGWWVVRITYGARMVSMEELTADLSSREPLAFAAFAAELNALGLPVPGSCPICCAG